MTNTGTACDCCIKSVPVTDFAPTNRKPEKISLYTFKKRYQLGHRAAANSPGRVPPQPARSVAVVEKESPTDRLSQNLIDVIIPMRNGAPTILATLASVLAQTRAPDHIFVIDDGSTDGSSELVRAHQIPSLTVIETGACGVSHARNVGINRSQADFVAFLDSDDLWAAEKLEQQLAVVQNDHRVAVVTCGSVSFDMDHHPIPGTYYSPRLRGNVFTNTLRQGFIRGGLSSNMLVRRSALVRVGGFDESMSIGEDIDLWLRLARHCIFDYCQAPLVYIVENCRSTTRRGAAAVQRREGLLQPLGCLEKWIDSDDSNRWILAFGARLILAFTLRERLTRQEMWSLREDIVTRAPKLGQRLARTRAHLIAASLLAALIYLPSAWATWTLRRRRLLSWKLRGPGVEPAIGNGDRQRRT